MLSGEQEVGDHRLRVTFHEWREKPGARRPARMSAARRPLRVLDDKAFNAVVDHALCLTSREERHLCVIVVGVDDDDLADDGNRAATEDVVAPLAARLCAALRESDTVCRIGPTEIGVVAMMKRRCDVGIVADKLTTCLGQPLAVEGAQKTPRFSVGASLARPHEDEVHDLIERAREAARIARTEGGSRWEVHSRVIGARARRKLALVNALNTGLAGRRFSVFYQPKVALGDTRLVGAEALLRWRNDKGRIVPATQFIPTAEQSDLISRLGTWVLNDVCRQMRQWLDRGLAVQPVSLNVSPRQLTTRGFGRSIREAADRWQIDPALLEIELTDSSVLRQSGGVRAELEELRRLGIRIAIDDFGTGDSSFGHLPGLPIDVLKIDRSFVAGMATQPVNADLVRLIIDLGRSLKMQVVAEGVESHDHCTFLRRHGCHVGQGYLFSRPLDAERYGALLPT